MKWSTSFLSSTLRWPVFHLDMTGQSDLEDLWRDHQFEMKENATETWKNACGQVRQGLEGNFKLLRVDKENVRGKMLPPCLSMSCL